MSKYQTRYIKYIFYNGPDLLLTGLPEKTLFKHSKARRMLAVQMLSKMEDEVESTRTVTWLDQKLY